mgnify:CR=1 FL=1
MSAIEIIPLRYPDLIGYRYAAHLFVSHLANDINNAIVWSRSVNVRRHDLLCARSRAVFSF